MPAPELLSQKAKAEPLSQKAKAEPLSQKAKAEPLSQKAKAELPKAELPKTNVLAKAKLLARAPAWPWLLPAQNAAAFWSGSNLGPRMKELIRI